MAHINTFFFILVISFDTTHKHDYNSLNIYNIVYKLFRLFILFVRQIQCQKYIRNFIVQLFYCSMAQDGKNCYFNNNKKI